MPWELYFTRAARRSAVLGDPLVDRAVAVLGDRRVGGRRARQPFLLSPVGLFDRRLNGWFSSSEMLRLTLGRMRKTHLQREQRPVAHTDTTLASEYLARDATAFGGYRKVVANALEAETGKARAVGRIAALSEQEVQEARQDPEAAARRHKVSAVTLKQLIAGEADSILAGCVDNTAGPFDPVGQPCTASFLKCLECPCARALPHHLPVQAIALEALESRRSQVTPLRWAQRFGRAHAHLADLLAQAPDGAVATARAAATDPEHQLVERLLAREMDHL